MFTNRKDPLVDAVKSVMSEGNLKRQVEEAVNNHFGVSSRKAIPHEHLAEYDALLSEAYKCAMEEEKPISHPNQKIISKQDGKPESISGEDFKILRKKKESGIAIKQEETQLDEKATEAQKEKVAKVMHKWKQGKEHIGKSKETVPVTKKGQKQAVAIALSQAGLSKNKKQMDESVESIMEEIRVNLEEQLMEAYEAGTEVFENFVNSLNEEQLDLLGLNEVFGDVFGGTGSSERQSILDRASQQTYLNRQRQAAGQRTVSAARPTPSAAPAARPTPAAPAARPTPAAKPTPTPTGTAARPAAPAAPAGTPAAKPTPTPTGTAGEREAATRAGADSTFDIPDVQQGGQYVHKKAETPSVNAGGQNVGIRSTNPETGQASGIATNPETGEKYVPPSETTKTQSTSSSKGWLGMGGFPSTQKESTHIRESLESFIRNKFIKG